MIAVVTGATGFVGQNLVRRLRRDGHEVRCLVRREWSERPPGVRSWRVRYDDPQSLLDCPALDGADVVFHLAAATKAVRAAAFTAANVVPTRHLLGALVARRLTPRFVFVSTQAAAGPAVEPGRPVTEEDPERPVEAYGRSKLEAERVVHGFAGRVPYSIVRPCALFGPGDRDFLTLFRMARRGVIPYPGVADHWLSVLHVDDFVDGALLAASARGAMDRTYFFASTAAVRWRELGELVASAVGRRVRHMNVPGPLISVAGVVGEWWGRLARRAPLANRSKTALSRERCWVCSASRARDELGFAPRHSLPDAVRETYLWYLEHGWLGGPSRTARPVH